VDNLPPSAHGRAFDASRAAGIVERAADAQCEILGDGDLASLCAAFGLTLGARGALRAPASVVDFRVSLEYAREFGLVLSAGSGGLDATLDENNFRRDRASVHAVVELTDAADFLHLFQRTAAYRKVAAIAQRDGLPLPDPALASCFAALLALGERLASSQQLGSSQRTASSHPLASGDTGTRNGLRTLALEMACTGRELIVTAARCAMGPSAARPLPRPIHKIDKLLHPASLGLIGVSATAMNFGRIILRNLMGSGYPKERLRIIRPGEAEVDGVRCVESIAALEGKLDLLIVAVSADAVYSLVDEIIATDKVEAVMLIPGGLGETRKSREPAAGMAARINAAHGKEGGGPVFLGANCLGVVSHPGNYDSWFIPLERLPKPKKKPERNSAMLSQSGAFMITRMSQNPWLDPRYMLAMGNQTDLTHGDFLTYFAERPEIETIGIYLEGFKDLDGLAFVRAVRTAVRNGKDVVVYKAGKTAPGVGGALGHTASIAGSHALFESVVRHAGAIVAEDVSAFDDLFYVAGALHAKRIGGNRLGAISGAGFEAVSMADSIESDSFAMEMGALAPGTIQRVQEILVAKKLDALVEVNNPIDINPGADDEAHLQVTEAFLQDPQIDAVVVALDPTAPSVRALEESKLRPGFDLNDSKSTVHLMPPIVARNDKPVIGVIDAGRLYDAMSARLMDQGVCVFRNCARATRALVRYVEARLYADVLRKRA
jgi:acyl-CoA synthetase (NDP forming)